MIRIPFMLLALAATPAFASNAPQAPVREPIKAITANPAQFAGQRIATEGYVLDRAGNSAEMGGTDHGMITSNSLEVVGPQIRNANYFDRYRILGVLRKDVRPHANGSPYALHLTTAPVVVGK